jgi:hypothetical protein
MNKSMDDINFRHFYGDPVENSKILLEYVNEEECYLAFEDDYNGKYYMSVSGKPFHGMNMMIEVTKDFFDFFYSSCEPYLDYRFKRIGETVMVVRFTTRKFDEIEKSYYFWNLD